MWSQKEKQQKLRKCLLSPLFSLPSQAEFDKAGTPSSQIIFRVAQVLLATIGTLLLARLLAVASYY